MDNWAVETTALEVTILAWNLAKASREVLETRLSERSPGLSGLQFGILRLLSKEPHTLTDLSHRLMLDPSTLVPAMDTLERKGLARRSKDSRDRRRTNLSATPAGVEAIAGVPVVEANDALVRCLSVLGAEQSKQLLHLLRELVRQLPGGEQIVEHAAAGAERALDGHSLPSTTART